MANLPSVLEKNETPRAELPVRPERPGDDDERQRQGQQRVSGRHVKNPGIHTGNGSHAGGIAFLKLPQCFHRARIPGTRATEQGAQDGPENQRVEQRPGQHGEHGHRQVAHELTRNTGPENQRQERSQGSCHGSGHGPEHAFGRQRVGAAAVETFNHLPVGVFGDDDGAVDQHAETEQHAEHDHEVECVSEEVQQDHREQQGNGNAEPDDDAAAETHGGHHHNHHERQRGEDISLQFGDLLKRPGRLVLRVENGHFAGQRRTEVIDRLFHGADRIDDVGVGTFEDVQ